MNIVPIAGASWCMKADVRPVLRADGRSVNKLWNVSLTEYH